MSESRIGYAPAVMGVDGIIRCGSCQQRLIAGQMECPSCKAKIIGVDQTTTTSQAYQARPSTENEDPNTTSQGNPSVVIKERHKTGIFVLVLVIMVSFVLVILGNMFINKTGLLSRRAASSSDSGGDSLLHDNPVYCGQIYLQTEENDTTFKAIETFLNDNRIEYSSVYYSSDGYYIDLCRSSSASMPPMTLNRLVTDWLSENNRRLGITRVSIIY